MRDHTIKITQDSGGVMWIEKYDNDGELISKRELTPLEIAGYLGDENETKN